jgi:ABC-2 type transport system ATP-binding protein
VAAVRASGLVKHFEATRALDGAGLVVQEGEVRGLLGPNGAGKTTLLRIIFGLVAADAGSVELFGRSRDPTESPVPDGVAGFVEDPSFYPYLSGRVNLELLAELDGGTRGARIAEVLARVGLSARGEDRLNGYSTGMRQRLGIAACLLREPRLLLLDEPTAGLDPSGVRQVGELVGGLASTGTAVVLSSHQIGEVEEVCDSFTVLSRGRVVWDGTAAQLRAQAPASAHALHTSDDARALQIAARQPGVQAQASDEGLVVRADRGSLDGLAVELGRADVAIRRLQELVGPLESMFMQLTGEGGTGSPDVGPPRRHGDQTGLQA